MSIQVPVPKTWSRGKAPSMWFGNGLDVTSNGGVALAEYINMLSGRRKSVLYRRSLEISDSTGYTGTGKISFEGLWHTSPNVGRVVCTMLCLPVDDNTYTLNPYIEWQLSTDGSSYSARDKLYVTNRKAATAVPDDFFILEQTWDNLTADQVYYSRCDLADNTRVIAVTIWEEPQDAVTVDILTTDAAAYPGYYHPRCAIHDRTIADLHDTSYNVWKRQGTNIANWGRHNNQVATYLSRNGTTYVNCFEAAFTDWAAGAPGFWCFPRLKGRAHSSNVPVVVSAQALITGAGPKTGTIVMRSEAGVDLCSLSVSGVASTAYSTTANLNSTHASDKLDFLFKVDDAADTIYVSRLSVYEYLA